MANQYRVKTGVKLYTQVLEQVKSMIAQGVYKKGDLLPSEKELIEMMGVSRITVRKALQILGEAGVIETRKGKGSFVAVDASELAPASMDLKKYCESFVQATQARLLLERGCAFSQAVHAGRFGTPYVETMLAVGEMTGTYDEALASIAVYYGSRLQLLAGRIRRWLGPVVLLLTGALMGVLILCFLLPLLDMASSIVT